MGAQGARFSSDSELFLALPSNNIEDLERSENRSIRGTPVALSPDPLTRPSSALSTGGAATLETSGRLSVVLPGIPEGRIYDKPFLAKLDSATIPFVYAVATDVQKEEATYLQPKSTQGNEEQELYEPLNLKLNKDDNPFIGIYNYLLSKSEGPRLEERIVHFYRLIEIIAQYPDKNIASLADDSLINIKMKTPGYRVFIQSMAKEDYSSSHLAGHFEAFKEFINAQAVGNVCSKEYRILSSIKRVCQHQPRPASINIRSQCALRGSDPLTSRPSVAVLFARLGQTMTEELHPKGRGHSII